MESQLHCKDGFGLGWGQGWGDSKHHERGRVRDMGWEGRMGQGGGAGCPEPGWPVDQFTVIQPS